MIQLYKPYINPNIPDLEGILKSGSISYGKWGRFFEEKLRAYLDNDLVLTVNSFNSAMLIAIASLGIKPGDEIIASPMSCLASNQPFATQYIKVVWADIDPKTGTLDPESVAARITPRTKAIVHNHFCGYVGDIAAINRLGKQYGIPVIDDGIEAFGSEYNGRRIGNVGTDITVFSFQSVRNPNTVDGGAITFSNKELYEKALLIRDYGIDRKNFRDDIGEISSGCDISIPGYGATMSDINSYIGTQQMECIDWIIESHRSNAEKWKQKIVGKGYNLLTETKHSNPNYWVFGILSNDKRETIMKFRQAGFYASGVHINNNIYSVFDNNDKILPGVKSFNEQFVALPSGWWIENGI